jgi:hypothetical protein
MSQVQHIDVAGCREDAAADGGADAAAGSQSDAEEEHLEPGGETGTLADLLK